jgi:hypothetical protein
MPKLWETKMTRDDSIGFLSESAWIWDSVGTVWGKNTLEMIKEPCRACGALELQNMKPHKILEEKIDG